MHIRSRPKIERLSPGLYRVSWRYHAPVAGTKRRHIVERSRITDTIGALRFASRHGGEIPAICEEDT